jgi:hypothetical protein
MPTVIQYSFSQSFSVSAQAAYKWSTDFQPDDHALMGEGNAKRQVNWISEVTVLLKETLPAGSIMIEKEKLIQLYPDLLMWTSTHLTGPNRYSQFIYEIISGDDNTSHLKFTALHLEQKENLSQKNKTSLTKNLCKYDSVVWKRLAEAMKQEIIGT